MLYLVSQRRIFIPIFALFAIIITVFGCTPDDHLATKILVVPHEEVWGIYELDLTNLAVRLIYSTQEEIQSSALRLNSTGNKLVFAQKVNGSADTDLEIFSIGYDGNDLRRITDNGYWDLYPVWSPKGDRIAFLSQRETDLDIYVMDVDGSNVQKLYDSGTHDADIDWADNTIVYTSDFVICRMNSNGTANKQVTNPSGEGEWGQANLPKGDYDPRLSRDGKRIVFERLEDNNNPNGGYNLFIINTDGTGETRFTDNSYSQGIANWSHKGDKVVYVVAAIEGEGKYDMYIINSDGTGNHNITPSYFPSDFLCYSPTFSSDDSKILFIGRWWK